MKLTKQILRSKFVQALLCKLVYLYIKFVLFTSNVKYTFQGFDFSEYENKQCIYTTWHGRILILPIINPSKLISCSIVSDHSDGRLLGDLIKQAGVKLVYGSSNRRPIATLKEIMLNIKNGYNFLIAPDGPRGPARQVKGAIIHIASATGVPIIPTSCSFSRAKILKSWDKFMFPLPFSKISIIFATPIKVPANVKNRDEYNEILRQSLDKITDIADADVNIPTL